MNSDVSAGKLRSRGRIKAPARSDPSFSDSLSISALRINPLPRDLLRFAKSIISAAPRFRGSAFAVRLDA